MKILNGNLITLAQSGEFDLIVHGCNCFCTMGSGIAKSIKQAFPEAYAADLATPKGDKVKMGTYSLAVVSNHGKKLHIVNGYTQYHWRGGGIKVDYDAIDKLFLSLKKDFPGMKIGYPLIGAGLAGGDWTRISAIIDKQLAGENHTLVVLAQ